MKKYEKPFEEQRARMDTVLADTFDLGQIHVLDSFIRVYEERGIVVGYEDFKRLRKILIEYMNRSRQ